jgi:nicotinate dehydrogenase subunit A
MDEQETPMTVLRFTLNGRPAEAAVDDADMPLLYLLRGDGFALNGPKFGCGLGQCGACTVLVDGIATRSCLTPAEAVAGREVTTLEGLGSPGAPHPLQAAFVAENAAQCGYCTNGMILQSLDLLVRAPRPDETAIREALANNLCRCGSHQRILRAVQRAAAG